MKNQSANGRDEVSSADAIPTDRFAAEVGMQLRGKVTSQASKRV